MASGPIEEAIAVYENRGGFAGVAAERATIAPVVRDLFAELRALRPRRLFRSVYSGSLFSPSARQTARVRYRRFIAAAGARSGGGGT